MERNSFVHVCCLVNVVLKSKFIMIDMRTDPFTVAAAAIVLAV